MVNEPGDSLKGNNKMEGLSLGDSISLSLTIRTSKLKSGGVLGSGKLEPRAIFWLGA